MKDQGLRGPKKPYDAPCITVISLRPEEAVLGNCKTSSQAGPVSAGCQNGALTCRGHGS